MLGNKITTAAAAKVTTSTDPFTNPPPRFKRYRVHGCSARHRTYAAWARCAWRRAAWVSGEGRYATVSRCRPGSTTVMLYETAEDALRWMRAVNNSGGCGGVCCGRHDYVEIVLDA